MIRFSCQCGARLEEKPGRGGQLVRCPRCGEAVEVPTSSMPVGVVDTPEPTPMKTTFESFRDALIYPLRFRLLLVILLTGCILVIGGLMIPVFAERAGGGFDTIRLWGMGYRVLFADYTGSRSRLFVVLAVLFLFCLFYLFEIVRVSCDGARYTPAFIPDSFWQAVKTGFEYVAGADACSFIPLWLCMWLIPRDETPTGSILAVVFLVLGCIYFPAALVSLAVWEGYGGFRPKRVLRVILNAPVASLLSAAALLVGVVAIYYSVVLPVSVWTMITLALGGFYLLVFAMRMIGNGYWVRRHEIGWTGSD